MDAVSDKLGHRLKLLVGKPGLDGHSNGAEQIAVRARDCGMDIVYDGIRLTPQEIVDAAVEKNVDVIGLSILSGSHISLVEEVTKIVENRDIKQMPIIVGGIIPNDDISKLEKMGVAKIYTPKNFKLNDIMLDVVSLVDQ